MPWEQPRLTGTGDPMVAIAHMFLLEYGNLIAE